MRWRINGVEVEVNDECFRFSSREVDEELD